MKHGINTPEPPYYSVIFTSQRTDVDDGYVGLNDAVYMKASMLDGFLGMESFRDENGYGASITYWKTLEDIDGWSKNMLHQGAKELGKKKFYEHYKVRICKVEKDYEFNLENENG